MCKSVWVCVCFLSAVFTEAGRGEDSIDYQVLLPCCPRKAKQFGQILPNSHVYLPRISRVRNVINTNKQAYLYACMHTCVHENTMPEE